MTLLGSRLSLVHSKRDSSPNQERMNAFGLKVFASSQFISAAPQRVRSAPSCLLAVVNMGGLGLSRATHPFSLFPSPSSTVVFEMIYLMLDRTHWGMKAMTTGDVDIHGFIMVYRNVQHQTTCKRKIQNLQIHTVTTRP